MVDAAGLAATIIRPAETWNGRVLYCLPGGGMSRRYFDLDAPGFSMAEHLAAQGFVVATVDHPGVGDSPAPEDGWSLIPALVADADAAAVAELRGRLGGIPIGVGHSMGGMLSVAVQSRHRTYAGLGLLGFGHSDDYAFTELAAMMTADELAVIGDADAIAAQLVSLAKARFGRPLPSSTTTRRSDFLLAGMAVSEEALAALDRCAAKLLACCGLGSMLKCAAPDVKQIDVPVFVGFGEHDIAGNARATADALQRCPDITLFELAGSGHNHNVAPNRTVLWNRLGRWALGIEQV